ncbi:hypothetical protein Lal_00006286 [Lupinus albus]|uniref:Putative F-box domain, leucine-rich repeat domain, L domain-containing protein n=1 Tax=Lupinus albus TaxID=3870 RepID=A0A6A4QAK9_LUPAL|nr:putative F-box domain, leucine-rich repeat domain, L domain-containing protein [Lupinus albus]KAF1875656.1 hypothetical protein Lal_00006286 [Lupinus albus]
MMNRRIWKDSSSRIKKKREDKLSNLPDELIHRILSFVDAKTAVQTSVLAHRWKNIWISLPFLNFHNSSFDHDFLFQDFVLNFLANRNFDAKIDVLKFECTGDELEENGAPTVDSVVDYVASKDIQVLTIIADYVLESLPRLFTSQTLTVLKLSNVSTETSAFEFVSLQQLHLFDCKFEIRDVEILDPFRGCPKLSFLLFHSCQFYGKFDKFKIHAPQLTELSISCLRVDDEFDSECVIQLFTPKLRYFSYDDPLNLYAFSILAKLHFLEKLVIDVDGSEILNEVDSTEGTKLSMRFIELFEAMGSAKFVYLSPDVVKVLSLFPALFIGRISPFTRVQTFNFIVDVPSSFSLPTNVMAYLLGRSPGFNRYRRQGSSTAKQSV